TFVLVRPDGKRVRLGLPEVVEGRPLLTAAGTSHAGIYRLLPADEAPATDATRPGEPTAEGESPGVPFAVVPDLRESEDLTSLTDGQLDERLEFKPVHLLAGDDPDVFSGADRLNREW